MNWFAEAVDLSQRLSFYNHLEMPRMHREQLRFDLMGLAAKK